MYCSPLRAQEGGDSNEAPVICSNVEGAVPALHQVYNKVDVVSSRGAQLALDRVYQVRQVGLKDARLEP